jgi:hypothetical protein
LQITSAHRRAFASVLYCLPDWEEENLANLNTNTRQVEGITIVDLGGRITLGEASVAVRDVISNLLN